MAGLGRKVFTAGDVLTASQVQDYLQDQTIMVFAGTAARSSAIPAPTEGMFAITKDDDELDYYNGSAWTPALPMGAWKAFTPTLSGWTVGTSPTIASAYTQIGSTIIWRCDLTFGTSPTFVGTLKFSLPVTSAYSTPGGSGYANVTSVMYTQGGSGVFTGIGFLDSTTTMSFSAQSVSGSDIALAALSSTNPATWAAGHRISFQLIYQAA
jgi:hypothetical protein